MDFGLFQDIYNANSYEAMVHACILLHVQCTTLMSDISFTNPKSTFRYPSLRAL